MDSTERFKANLLNVKAFAFDVDGVCTNNQVLISESGQLLRPANTRDGYAISQANRHGFPVAIITGGRTQSVATRFEMLGCKHIYLGVADKVAALRDFCQKVEIAPEAVLYMGDDMPDYHAMLAVGFPTCPCDAAPEIQRISRYISGFRGGEGCVRDVVEQVLKLHNHWHPGESAHQ